MADEYLMTIGGKSVGGASTFEVLNPATGEIVGLAPDASQVQVDEVMAAAQDAFAPWRRNEEARRTALHNAADALEGAVDLLAPLLTKEQGKPIANSRGEVVTSAKWLRVFADFEITPEIVQDDETALIEVVRRPLGVTVAITPWNVPLILAAWKIAPALRTGNTVVIKPSPYTPLATLEMIRILSEVFPPGVINALSGNDRLGPWLTGHTVPRKVSFTGSTNTGRAVGLSSLRDFKRLTLELGGNDPAVVLDDADVDAIADKLFWGAFANAGQVCLAVKRIYVPTALHESLVDALADRARSVVLGNGLDPQTKMGPLNNEMQRNKIIELVDDARANGGTVVVGGNALPGPGYFYEPTIVTGLGAGARLVEEEQFGPAVPVIAYEDVDDVLDQVNSSNLGLGGSVWGKDLTRMRAVALEIESGTVWMNAHGGITPYQPFGGLKSSGLGLEHGRWGIESFTDAQVFITSRG